jgi:hypothetical protein
MLQNPLDDIGIVNERDVAHTDPSRSAIICWPRRPLTSIPALSAEFVGRDVALRRASAGGSSMTMNAERQRLHVYYTPTYASRINQVAHGSASSLNIPFAMMIRLGDRSQKSNATSNTQPRSTGLPLSRTSFRISCDEIFVSDHVWGSNSVKRPASGETLR